MTRAVLAFACCLALAGCGLGPGAARPGGTDVTVTRDFGARPLGHASAARVPADETAMRQLQRTFEVTTRYGGGFVQSIRGLKGGTERGRSVDWFFYVNGIEAGRGAAAYDLHAGDRVWWDRHDWGAAMRIPAVVGSFPEPFRHGTGGRRLPVRLDCASDAREACDRASARLSAVGVPAARAQIGRVSDESLRIVVGLWPQARGELAVRALEEGPGRSGVYVRMARDGRSIALLDERGRVARTLGAGSGLVAATADGDEPPTWVVTGTDEAGLMAAAGALTRTALASRFALAIERGTSLRVPQP